MAWRASIEGLTKGPRAVVYLPDATRPGAEASAKPAEVDVLLYLHGYKPEVDQDVKDKIGQSVQSSGRLMVAVLPQWPAYPASSFGEAFDSDEYLSEVFGRLKQGKELSEQITAGRVVVAGHSGAGRPIGKMLGRMLRGEGKGLPRRMAALMLFEAINPSQKGKPSWQLETVQKWVEHQLNEDLGKLTGCGTFGEQQRYLEARTQFRAYQTGSPRARPDPRSRYYAPLHAVLERTIDKWFSDKDKGTKLFDAPGKKGEPIGKRGEQSEVWKALRRIYDVKAVTNLSHRTIVRGKLTEALQAAAPAPSR